MPQPPTTIGPAPATPLSRLGRVDLACDAFEAAWERAPRPQIEAFLATAPESDRPELFARLLDLELALRRGLGESPTPSPYLSRFPNEAQRIARGFSDESTGPDFQVAEVSTSLDGLDAQDETSPPTTIGPAGEISESGQAPELPLPIGKVLGEYELLEELGKGGMGVVHKAWQRGAGRVVALKLIRPSWLARLGVEHSQTAIALFLNEARAAASLHHDNIVTVFNVGMVDGRPYYSMRLVKGFSLARRLKTGSLTNAEAIKLMEPVARGVDHAHKEGVLHRDLKPDNILIDGDGTPFVADFGLAKLMAGPTGPGQGRGKLGTPPYMSPEQADGHRKLGPTSDVYNLGATLYEMLTGRPPFQAPTNEEVFERIQNELPVWPRQLNRAIHRDLEAICLKCLEKDPERRYPSAGDLAADLRRCRDGLPTVARPVWFPVRAVRRARRSPVASLAAAAVVLLVAGLVVRDFGKTATLRQVATLAQPIPSGTTPRRLDVILAEKSDAAIALARSGHSTLARDLLSRRCLRQVDAVLRARLLASAPEEAPRLLRELILPEPPPIAQNTDRPRSPWRFTHP